MTAEIIQFGRPTVAKRKTAVHERAAFAAGDVQTPEVAREAGQSVKRALTATAKNSQIRRRRRQVWRKADAATDYWYALVGLHNAVGAAALYGLREGRLLGFDFSEEARWNVVGSYRSAVFRQFLTPAPDVAAVNWKRAHLDQALYAGGQRECLERVIADDVAFLKAHPTRREPEPIQPSAG